MKGIITAPKKVITGAFTILFSFWREIELSMADIRVETLEGDALGHSKDCFSGSGSNYHLCCYIPDARAGKSRVSVTKAGVDVEPVIVEYDTVRTVTAIWESPIQRGSKIELPLSFDVPIQKLKKRNFRLSVPTPFQLYGTGDAYSLVLPNRRLTVSVSGTVEKRNGIRAEILAAVLEV